MPNILSRFVLVTFIVIAVLSLSIWDVCHAAAYPQRGVDLKDRERQVERVRRFFQRTLDDLNLSRQLTEEDIADLENESDSIPPLEPVQREADLLSLLDTYYSYLDWLKDRIEDFDGDLEQLSVDNLPGSEVMENSFVEMVATLRDLEKVLQGKIDGFDSEEKRIAGIIERRRVLQERIDDLGIRLERIEKKLDDRQREASEKERGAEERIRGEIRVVQAEIQSLPQVNEDILKHFVVMKERGKGEAQWIALQIDEYALLGQTAALLPRDTYRFGKELNKAIRATIKAYESEIALINRRIDGLEKSRSRISPAGTLRETERSRELTDLYDRLQIRYNDLINRLKVRIGAWQAESSELMSVK